MLQGRTLATENALRDAWRNHIISQLATADISRLSQTCKFFDALINGGTPESDHLWRQHLVHRGVAHTIEAHRHWQSYTAAGSHPWRSVAIDLFLAFKYKYTHVDWTHIDRITKGASIPWRLIDPSAPDCVAEIREFPPGDRAVATHYVYLQESWSPWGETVTISALKKRDGSYVVIDRGAPPRYFKNERAARAMMKGIISSSEWTYNTYVYDARSSMDDPEFQRILRLRYVTRFRCSWQGVIGSFEIRDPTLPIS